MEWFSDEFQWLCTHNMKFLFLIFTMISCKKLILNNKSKSWDTINLINERKRFSEDSYCRGQNKNDSLLGQWNEWIDNYHTPIVLNYPQIFFHLFLNDLKVPSLISFNIYPRLSSCIRTAEHKLIVDIYPIFTNKQLEIKRAASF